MTQKDAQEEFVFQIKVQGNLSYEWTAWLNGMRVTLESDEPPVTILTGSVVDQSKLRGIINKLWDLNLTLLSVNRLK